jgi:hypothetical protein
MTTAIAKLDAHIAELRTKVFTLECAQQTCVLQKIDDIKDTLMEDTTELVSSLLQPLTMKINMFDTVLQNLIKEQKKMARDIETLKFEDHKKMCRDIVNLQQTISIMQRKRRQVDLNQHQPISAQENVQLVQLRNLRETPVAAADAVDIAARQVSNATGYNVMNVEKEAMDTRMNDIVESLDILNHMHRNLRAELAEMNLVHA